MLKDLCFEIIQTCPNNCIFCSSDSSIDKRQIIDIDLFKKTIDRFMVLGGIEEISISGGEPFLHPDLFEMVKYCKDKMIRTSIYTSGIINRNKIPNEVIERLKPEERRIIEMVNKSPYSEINKEKFLSLKKSGLDKIVFDFQSIEVEEYDKLMGTKGNLAYAIKSIILAKSTGLNVDVHFIPNKINYKQFPDIIEVLNIAEVQNLSILNFVPQGKGREHKEELQLNDSEMQEFTEIFNFYRNKFNGKIRIGIPLISNNEHMCTAGYDKLNIKYDGTVLPCPAFKEIELDTLFKYGITLYNIHTDLDKVQVMLGNRDKPLCREVHKFTGRGLMER